MSLYGIFSQTLGSDGNGLLSPSDPALGGHSGSVLTASASGTAVMATGGFSPPDLQVTEVEAVVTIKTPQSGAPTAGGSIRIKGTFRRSGTTVTQVGTGQTIGAELDPAIGSVSARWTVDTGQSPNQITVQCTPNPASSPALAWAWSCSAPTSA